MPGKLNPMYRKNVKDFMTEEAYNEKCRKQSKSLKETYSKKTPEERKLSELTRKRMRENHRDVSGEKILCMEKN